MHLTEHKTTHNSIYLTGFTGEQYTHTSTCRQSFQSLVWFHLPRTLHNGCVAFHWAPISWWADVIRSNSGWSTGTTGGIWSHLICRGSCRPLGCRPPATRPSPPPWAEASQGLAALVRPLSASPACPCLEQAHTASTANHPCCQPFANTSKRPKHLGSGSKNSETLLLCGLLANCTFLLQAVVISAAAAEGESQLDLRRLYLARQHSAGFFLHQWLDEQLYNYLLCWLILIPDQLFSTTQKRSQYYMILLFLASTITLLRSSRESIANFFILS